MLPNWLLGKSKSKLQEILGGGGGETYTAGDGIDISSGVISFDPSTMAAIPQSKVTDLGDDLADLAPKTAISNPNILHNPWFTVNQRAATSLTAAGKIADRWGCTANGSWTVARTNDGYIDIDNSDNTNTLYLLQKRTSTYLNSLHGYPLTASVMFSDGTIVSGTKMTSSGTVYIDTEDISVTRNFQDEIFNLNVKPGKHVTIKALKLEVGEISTLHLDPRPEYAVELAKCQRYYQRLYIGSSVEALFLLCKAINTTNARIKVPIAPMRTTPTLSVGDVTKYYLGTTDGGSATIQISSPSVVSYNPNTSEVLLQFGASGLTAGNIYSLYQKGTSESNYFDLNAEL